MHLHMLVILIAAVFAWIAPASIAKADQYRFIIVGPGRFETESQASHQAQQMVRQLSQNLSSHGIDFDENELRPNALHSRSSAGIQLTRQRNWYSIVTFPEPYANDPYVLLAVCSTPTIHFPCKIRDTQTGNFFNFTASGTGFREDLLTPQALFSTRLWSRPFPTFEPSSERILSTNCVEPTTVESKIFCIFPGDGGNQKPNVVWLNLDGREIQSIVIEFEIPCIGVGSGRAIPFFITSRAGRTYGLLAPTGDVKKREGDCFRDFAQVDESHLTHHDYSQVFEDGLLLSFPNPVMNSWFAAELIALFDH